MFEVIDPILKAVSYTEPCDALVIIGPTGSGKTQLSLDLAKTGIPLEVISVDAFQVYKGMDIGTAKASLKERTEVDHHMIDILEVHERHTVVDFLNKAIPIIHDIRRRRALPVFVGGSMFYVERLFLGAPPTSTPNLHIRALLEERKNKEGIHVLYRELEQKDPEAAKSLTYGDGHKIIRALEIIDSTGGLLSECKPKTPPCVSPLSAFVLQVTDERENLRKKVLDRCELMIQSGLIEEIEQLMNKGLRNAPMASVAIGYKQFIPFVDQVKSWEDSLSDFKKASLSLIKKQITWLRSREKLFCSHKLYPGEGSPFLLDKFSSWTPNTY